MEQTPGIVVLNKKEEFEVTNYKVCFFFFLDLGKEMSNLQMAFCAEEGR